MCSTTPATQTKRARTLGDDLREGKTTLPLILAMQRGTPEQTRISFARPSRQGDTTQFDAIVAIVRETGALDATRDAAATEARRAMRSNSCVSCKFALR